MKHILRSLAKLVDRVEFYWSQLPWVLNPKYCYRVCLSYHLQKFDHLNQVAKKSLWKPSFNDTLIALAQASKGKLYDSHLQTSIVGKMQFLYLCFRTEAQARQFIQSAQGNYGNNLQAAFYAIDSEEAEHIYC